MNLRSKFLILLLQFIKPGKSFPNSPDYKHHLGCLCFFLCPTAGPRIFCGTAKK